MQEGPDSKLTAFVPPSGRKTFRNWVASSPESTLSRWKARSSKVLSNLHQKPRTPFHVHKQFQLLYEFADTKKQHNIRRPQRHSDLRPKVSIGHPRPYSREVCMFHGMTLQSLKSKKAKPSRSRGTLFMCGTFKPLQDLTFILHSDTPR